MMNYISLFSGVGGFDLGFDRAGMRCVYQVERDPHCLNILQRHWPDVPRHNDVATFNRSVFDGAVDLVCGGFPCQDVSVAGKRAGLAGERSGLWWEFARILSELTPTWVCIENVPGLLSSNGGRDMGAVLWTLGQLGYGWAYRVLDAQWFGVAQRRRRVFIAGHTGGRTDRAAQVLFESDCLPWDSAPSRETGQAVAGTLAAHASGGFRNDLDGHGAYVTVGSLAPRQEGDGDNATSFGVRRLTPIEFERLQGFPDGWTAGQADTHRYRQLGNAVCVPVAEWAGRRMVSCCTE